MQNFTYLYLPVIEIAPERGNLYNAHAWLCPDFVFVLSRSDYIDIPEYAMLRVSLPKTPGPAEV